LNQSDFFFYRRNLPHFISNGGIYFVTFRLAGTIPLSVLEQFKRDNKTAILRAQGHASQIAAIQLEKKQKGMLFRLIEDHLDYCKHGERLFAQDDLAEIVMSGIKKRDGTMYRLFASTIMPNHVHMVLCLNEQESHPSSGKHDLGYRLANVIGSLKKRTSSIINCRLGRSGQLWQYETFDHLVRNAEELERIVRYVLYNPVKAGLVKDPSEWKWNYWTTDYL